MRKTLWTGLLTRVGRERDVGLLLCAETVANKPKQSARGAAERTKVPVQRLWPVFPSGFGDWAVKWSHKKWMVCLLQPTFGLPPHATANPYPSCNRGEQSMVEFPESLSSDLGVAMVTIQICSFLFFRNWVWMGGANRSGNRASMIRLISEK